MPTFPSTGRLMPCRGGAMAGGQRAQGLGVRAVILVAMVAGVLATGCNRRQPCIPGAPDCVCASRPDGSADCQQGICPVERACGDQCCFEGTVCLNGDCVDADSACIYIPGPGEFDAPEILWWWPFRDPNAQDRREIELPQFDQVMSTPAVVRLRGTHSEGEAPAVVFNTYRTGGGPNEEGVLRAIRGDTGAPLWSVTDPDLRSNGLSSVAVGDLTGDGYVEVVTGAWDPNGGYEGGLLAFRHDGSLLWRRPGIYVGWGGAAIADLDADGRPEVVIGNTVLNGATGEIRCSGGQDALGDNGVGPLSVVADIDADGRPEIVTGTMAYRLEQDDDGNDVCRKLWPVIRLKNGERARDGFVAVADVLDEPHLPTTQGVPEIVVVSRGTVRIHDWTGGIIYDPIQLPGGGLGGPPTLADYTGDGKLEIGVADLMAYTVIKPGVGILWTAPTQDWSSSTTGSSVFDFDGNGRAEVVYIDECYLHVFDGPTGQVEFQAENTSCTAYEMPVPVDVTGDGSAELVVPANRSCSIECPYGSHAAAGHYGIRVFTSQSDSWVGSRPVWNQHAYNVTNVGDNGEIPREQDPWWATSATNAFRQNYQGQGTFAAPNLTVTRTWLDGSDCPDRLLLRAEVENVGARGIRAGLPVAFYEEVSGGRDLLGVAFLNEPLQPGESGDVTLEWRGPPRLNPVRVIVHADDDGTGSLPMGRHRECDETNNTRTLEDVICREVG